MYGTKDRINVIGCVNVQMFEHDRLICSIVENNLVVTLGKTNMAKLLGGEASGLPITQVGIGSNGIPSAVTDSALTNPYIKAVDSVSYPDAQSVAFHFEIKNNEGNGTVIREFGLFNSANVLCARKVRDSEITKTNVIRLVGSWTITIN